MTPKSPYQTGRESMYQSLYRIVEASVLMYKDLRADEDNTREKDCLDAVVDALESVRDEVEGVRE